MAVAADDSNGRPEKNLENETNTPDVELAQPLTTSSRPRSSEAESYIEVLNEKKVLRFTSLNVVREHLLSGKLTRHNQCRWIEPKPIPGGHRQDEVRQYRRNLKEWEKRRQWRPIGVGLAQEEDKIQLLYQPTFVFWKWGFGIVFAVCLIGGMIGLLYYVNVTDFEPSSNSNIRYPGVTDWICNTDFGQDCMLVVLLAVPIVIVSASVSLVLGGPIGILLAKVLESRLPRPPDDGWRPPRES